MFNLWEVRKISGLEMASLRYLDGNYRQKEYYEKMPEAQAVFGSELYVIKC